MPESAGTGRWQAVGPGRAILPVDRNDTEPGRAKNRRVEVWLR